MVEQTHNGHAHHEETLQASRGVVESTTPISTRFSTRLSPSL